MAAAGSRHGLGILAGIALAICAALAAGQGASPPRRVAELASALFGPGPERDPAGAEAPVSSAAQDTAGTPRPPTAVPAAAQSAAAPLFAEVTPSRGAGAGTASTFAVPPVDGTAPPLSGDPAEERLVTPSGAVIGLIATQLSDAFASTVYATALEGDERIFVLERAGRIRIFVNGGILPTPFFDIVGNVGLDGEEGLLGMAFDPDFATNGLAYILYSHTSGTSRVSRIRAGTNPNVAPDSSEEILLTVDQPNDNHNGGTLLFGPDGYLYIGFGDGGGSFDPPENAQNRQTLLGKMLRIDPGGPGAGYSIPADNPFVGDGSTLDEIWALGLRNPYRFSFDWMTGDLWIGDVGEGLIEEIDFEPADSPGGLNYGWDVKEGSDCNDVDPAPAPPCDDPSLVDPEYEYGHESGRCSVTGGVVYRGPEADGFGEYFFADFCSGEIWSYDPGTGMETDRTSQLSPAAGPNFQVVAITEDGFGAMLVTHLNGSVYRIGPTGSECDDGSDNDGDGAIDDADSGCRNGSDPSELDSQIDCDDGYDNDRDGDIDFPEDDDCQSATSNSESGAGGGGDGDGDGSGGGGGGGGGCGLGPELSVVLLALAALRRRRFASTS